MSDQLNRDEVLAKIEKAMQTVSGLCDGRIRWTMSVPARPDSDPDLVIADALASARALLSAERQDAALDRAVRLSLDRSDELFLDKENYEQLVGDILAELESSPAALAAEPIAYLVERHSFRASPHGQDAEGHSWLEVAEAGTKDAVAVYAAPPSSNQTRNEAIAGEPADIDTLVNRFLAWPLPKSVCSDGCASMPGYPHRIGTNLLTADEAKAMFLHCLQPSATSAAAPAQQEEPGLTAKQAWWAGYRAGKGLPPDTPRQEAFAPHPVAPAQSDDAKDEREAFDQFVATTDFSIDEIMAHKMTWALACEWQRAAPAVGAPITDAKNNDFCVDCRTYYGFHLEGCPQIQKGRKS